MSSQQMTEAQRKRLTRLLFGLLVTLVLIGGFGPAYVSGRSEAALFDVQCANAEYNVAQLKATQLTLKAQSQIAHDLALPVSMEIDGALKAYVIPEVPSECDA
jgi:hypothetical protein